MDDEMAVTSVALLGACLVWPLAGDLVVHLVELKVRWTEVMWACYWVFRRAALLAAMLALQNYFQI